MPAKRFCCLQKICFLIIASILLSSGSLALALDKINMIYTARVMSQSYPWFAHEA
jgi:hypothetical protein